MRKLSHKAEIFVIIALIASMVFSSFSAAFGATYLEKKREAQEAGKKAKEANEKAYDLELQGLELMRDIEANEAKIEKTKIKLKKKKAEVKAQQDALNERLSVMYKTGTVGFVDVILSSDNITELISNINAVQKILENDQNILAGLQDDLAEIKKLEKKLEEQRSALKAQKAELEELRKEYLEKAKEYEAEEAALNAEAEAIGRISSEYFYSGSMSDSGVCFPVQGAYVYTDYFGWRKHPFTGVGMVYHSGYDICLVGGSYGKPCYAVRDGVVTLARNYSNFGNCIKIDVGDGYEVLYGHLSGYAISEGQYVYAGQVVGYIGSTGWSTGPHLHFGCYHHGDLVDAAVVVPGMGY